MWIYVKYEVTGNGLKINKIYNWCFISFLAFLWPYWFAFILTFILWLNWLFKFWICTSQTGFPCRWIFTGDYSCSDWFRLHWDHFLLLRTLLIYYFQFLKRCLFEWISALELIARLQVLLQIKNELITDFGCYQSIFRAVVRDIA